VNKHFGSRIIVSKAVSSTFPQVRKGRKGEREGEREREKRKREREREEKERKRKGERVKGRKGERVNKHFGSRIIVSKAVSSTFPQVRKGR
jgi:hypothetical protein